MGVGTEELLKQIETGNLRSVNFLPNFADKVREFVRESGQLEASLKTSQRAMGRFKNAFEQGVLSAFDAGAEKGLAAFFKDLTVSMKKLEPLFEVIGKVAGAVFEILGQLARAIVQVIGPMKNIGSEGGDAIDGLNKKLKETLTLVDSVIAGFKFLASVVTIIPSLTERLEKKAGFELPSLSQAIGFGTVRNLVSAGAGMLTSSPAQGGGTTNKTTTINVQANDAFHVAQIVKDSLQEDLSLNYGD